MMRIIIYRLLGCFLQNSCSYMPDTAWDAGLRRRALVSEKSKQSPKGPIILVFHDLL